MSERANASAFRDVGPIVAAGDIVADQLQVLPICFEGHVGKVAHERNAADNRVEQNVREHAKLRPATHIQLASRPDDIQRHGSRGGIANAGNQANNRIPTEADACARNAKRFIQPVSPPQQRHQSSQLFLFSRAG